MPRPLLVGVSGGADSTYLLHQLAATDPDGLVICHLNHGLRGEDSDRDQDFVSALCKRKGLRLEQKEIDLSRIMEAEKETSMETIARRERLNFFREVGEKHGTSHVALAHHADDQAETILMNLCRGSAGLKGIDSPSHLADYGLTLWRPFLKLRKSEILTWLRSKKHDWREDASNQDPIATRNRVRNELLPLMDNIFQREVSAQIIRASQPAPSNVLPEILEALKIYDPQGRLYLPTIETFSPALQQLIIHTYLKEQHVENLSESHIRDCLSLITDQNIWKVNLPGHKHLRRREKRLFLEH